MNIFTSLSILVFSMLIIASMKLTSSIFALFYHYASGKYSVKKVDVLSIFFILGAEILPAVIFTALNLLLNIFSHTNFNPTSNAFLLPIASILIALGLAYFLFYFRHERGAKLFLSRSSASIFEQKAKSINTSSDALILGFISGIPELLFTLPLYLIVLIDITKNIFLVLPCSIIFILFILSTVCPLFFVYLYFKTNHNLANFIKSRIKNKNFFRFLIPIFYFLLATIIIMFKVIQ